MFRSLRSLAVVGLLAVAAVPSLANGPGGAGRPLAAALEQLDLSEAQRAEIQRIRHAAREAAAPLRDELREGRMALREALDAGADDRTIATLARSQHALGNELRDLRKGAMQQAKAVLTPEQQAQLQAMRAERQGARGQGAPGAGRGGQGRGGLQGL
jgi:protein CpxP